MSLDRVRYCTFNVNGIADDLKRRQIFDHIRRMDIHIAFIQETHCTNEKTNRWQIEWGGNIFHSNATSNSAGVMILFARGFVYNIKKIVTDKEGRALLLEVIIGEQCLLLVNMYAPNTDNPQFYTQIMEMIDAFDNCNIIWGGDFNLVLDPTMDRYNSSYNKPKATKILIDYIQQNDLYDIWRTHNPTQKRYTWFRSTDQMSRIDIFLVNQSIVPFVTSTQIASCPLSDHSPVIMEIKMSAICRGPGTWKLNVSHLENPEFLQGLNDCVDDFLNKTASWYVEKRWEELKETIAKYCKTKSLEIASATKKEIKKLYKQLEETSKKIEADPERASGSLRNHLHQINAKIKEISEYRARGIMLRCKQKWYAEGQRSSKYFFSLEKVKARGKLMTQLKTNDGTLVNTQKEIMAEQVQFFTQLYTSNEQVNFDLVLGPTDRVLSDEQVYNLNTQLTLAEIQSAVMSMPNGKTPGSDGLPAEIYKVLWPKIGQLYFEMILNAIDKGTLAITARQGIITLIPKKHKNRLLLGNWCPLTMLNVDHKIFAKALAGRMKKVLPSIIHPDQTGFMQGRDIKDNIRRAIEVMEYAENEQIPGILMSIDYYKCFDCIEHESIWAALKIFRFPDSFITMVKVLFASFTSRIQCNGYMSESIPIL